MCGFVGAFTPRGITTDDRTLEAMRDRMVHRGPDGAGLWRSRSGTCALAHRRLSIIDLSDEAAQPMSTPDGRMTIAFNGEIYNHSELREQIESDGDEPPFRTDHSDTEALLRGFGKFGLDVLPKLRGMYAFAIHDTRRSDIGELHLVRDRVGVKPLYLTRTDRGEWLFGSEIRALTEHPDVTVDLEPLSLAHYLTFIVAPAPLTMFRGIFKIPAGHGVTIDERGNARAWKHWDLRVEERDRLSPSDITFDDAVEEFGRRLGDSISRRMVSDVPFGVLLSGGVDSGLNVALMAERMERPVQTFTIGYEGEDETNEFRHARVVAEKFGADHHEALIRRADAEAFLPELVQLQDEPIADNVCIPLYFLAKSVKENGCTVVQVGEGADENFLGYWWCDHYRDKEQNVYGPARRSRLSLRALRDRFTSRVSDLAAEDDFIRDRARRGRELFWGGAACFWGPIRDGLVPDARRFRSEVDCPVEGLLPPEFASTDSHDVVRALLNPGGAFPSPEVLHKIPYLEMKLRLPEHLLMRVDKLTMAHSVEARVPFLDPDVVDFASRLPREYLLDDGVGKRLVKKFAERHLPHDIVYRKKQGFGAPMESWFADADFRARCDRALERSDIVREGYIDPRWVREKLDAYERGLGGYSFHLWTVFNVLLWHESWVRGEPDCFR